jgi:hypothetical protein
MPQAWVNGLPQSEVARLPGVNAVAGWIDHGRLHADALDNFPQGSEQFYGISVTDQLT